MVCAVLVGMRLLLARVWPTSKRPFSTETIRLIVKPFSAYHGQSTTKIITEPHAATRCWVRVSLVLTAAKKYV